MQHKHLLMLATMVLAALPLEAQSLSLREAMRRADSAAYANRIATGQARAQAGQATAALQGILPTLRAEGGYLQTDDPLAAFGILLRQRDVTQASFNPDELNFPAARTNWSGGVVAELPLINADAWYGRSAATASAAAGASQAGWTRETTRVQVVRAYYGAILARDQVQTLEEATLAAHGHVRQAESLVANGMATKSDALLAGVQAGRFDADLIAARSGAALARKRLALLLGAPDDTAFVLPERLPESDRIRALASATVDSTTARLDVTAAQQGLAAAERDASRATSRYLPRVNAFGRYDWNDPTNLFGGEKSYTIGVMASWTPFAGASEIGDRQATNARTDAARAMVEAAEAQARLEQQATESDVEVALARLGIAETAVLQGAEAHRIVARKYEGGLATVVELLGASAVDTQTRLGLAEARYQAIVAEAARRQAAGRDLAALTTLEE
jgi:outer membrane protein TolC